MKTSQWAELAEVLDPGGGDDAPPRRLIIWHGPHYRESWIERRHGTVHFHVRTDDQDSDPMDVLTDEMRRMIRPDDELVIFGMVDNKRDLHLQTDRPPWKRKPWRAAGPRQFELETSPGTWEAMEELP